MITTQALTGMVLAGGEGRRMGGRDKGLEPFAGLPLFAHTAAKLEGQIAELLISANRNLDAYRLFGRVISDVESGFQGPLMGIYSGLRASNTPWLLIAPCDTPHLPDNLVAQMLAGIQSADIAVAFDGQHLHPTVALIRTALADDLQAALKSGERKIQRWYARHNMRRVDMSDCPDAFTNLNTAEEKSRLEAQCLSAREVP
ncbi:Molybdopterin-guanine dinucleotide biosynthesis protein MobA [Halomonas citrativorans]|uniref:Molybdenum cofactor guanylyltransferase n=1 Tax=Halomonas citrativorans TaxID=2742612 RepID=A0A1R4I4B7_9GAMM|nr:molybdenum cofactor guanylyltransferase MobA [Halomonas citrativorans]SJN14707.1 Molybdopterin-guanine dinucleotide biosynthesis protein MobA [Halomonas citrativorans]